MMTRTLPFLLCALCVSVATAQLPMPPTIIRSISIAPKPLFLRVRWNPKNAAGNYLWFHTNEIFYYGREFAIPATNEYIFPITNRATRYFGAVASLNADGTVCGEPAFWHWPKYPDVQTGYVRISWDQDPPITLEICTNITSENWSFLLVSEAQSVDVKVNNLAFFRASAEVEPFLTISNIFALNPLEGNGQH